MVSIAVTAVNNTILIDAEADNTLLGKTNTIIQRLSNFISSATGIFSEIEITRLKDRRGTLETQLKKMDNDQAIQTCKETNYELEYMKIGLQNAKSLQSMRNSTQ
ncbi:hypothetical protein MTZ49_11365 [Entomomonas sp. E2T0]|uniref:hypothetical protein n=1 Tax=Entomomonas sp. E2T0 TaxID=2930213 RepID=UPI0022282754|nr:hypothetical protein [Entomomonas sp. E2T0]UYZ83193.1 hypothetical protein MTZ49_11365 [Entomomonas sp. E2T0]